MGVGQPSFKSNNYLATITKNYGQRLTPEPGRPGLKPIACGIEPSRRLNRTSYDGGSIKERANFHSKRLSLCIIFSNFFNSGLGYRNDCKSWAGDQFMMSRQVGRPERLHLNVVSDFVFVTNRSLPQAIAIGAAIPVGPCGSQPRRSPWAFFSKSGVWVTTEECHGALRSSR